MRTATKQTVRCALIVMALALLIVASAAARADMDEGSVQRMRSFAPSQSEAPAGSGKDAQSDDAPPTREQILKEGPVALQQHCMECHQQDKWEGTNRDRDGWTAIVMEMSRQMVEARMPPMSERTANVIVSYLTLTRPQ